LTDLRALCIKYLNSLEKERKREKHHEIVHLVETTRNISHCSMSWWYSSAELSRAEPDLHNCGGFREVNYSAHVKLQLN
jgi:hypothetical protein